LIAGFTDSLDPDQHQSADDQDRGGEQNGAKTKLSISYSGRNNGPATPR
jgi:hypothetical protein